MKLGALLVALSLVAGMVIILPIMAIQSTASAAAICKSESNGEAAWSAPSAAAKNIPAVAYEAYVKAAQKHGLDWVYLAAIGEQESGHGTAYGNKLDSAGTAKPGVFGTPTPYGRAMGPMQFIPSTWKAYGRDGNGDGKKDPQNIYDAAFASAAYLRASGAPGNWDKAIYAYNHAGWYVTQVKEKAAKYRKEAANSPVSSPISTTIDGRVWPVGKGNIGAHFGQAGGSWSSGYHTGQDFGRKQGTTIYAAHDGQVVEAGFGTRHSGWAGGLVIVRASTKQGAVVETWYAHQSKVDVKKGDTVKAGQRIGRVGSTGNSTGPHLHFEVTINGKRTDPLKWLSGAEDAPTGDRIASSVFIVGDSLTVGTVKHLRAAFGKTDYDVDALGGRTMAQGIEILKKNKNAQTAATWIVALGTNNPQPSTYGKQIDQVLKLAKQRQVVIPTIGRVHSTTQKMNDILITKGIENATHLSTPDAAAVPASMVADQVGHLTDAGYKWRAELYASSVKNVDERDACGDGSDMGPVNIPGLPANPPSHQKMNENRLQRNAVKTGRVLLAAFPEIKSIGGYRPDRMQYHPSGTALDVMVDDNGKFTKESEKLGYRIGQFLLRYGKQLGVNRFIWLSRISYIEKDPNTGFKHKDPWDPKKARLLTYGGCSANPNNMTTVCHYDHLHVDTFDNSGRAL